MTLVHVLINKIVQFVKVHKYPAVVQICEAYFPLQGYSVRQIRRKKCGSGFVSITNGYENQSIMEILQQGVYKTVFMLSLRINHSLFFFLSFNAIYLPSPVPFPSCTCFQEIGLFSRAFIVAALNSFFLAELQIYTSLVLTVRLIASGLYRLLLV